MVIGSVVLWRRCGMICGCARELPVRPVAPSLARANARRGDPRLVASAKSDEMSRGTASMASGWSYSSFMPSLPPQKVTIIQSITTIAPNCRRPVPHAKFAICTFLVRRTKLVHQLNQEAARVAERDQPERDCIEIALYFWRAVAARNLLRNCRQRRLRLGRIDAASGGCVPEAHLLRGLPASESS